MAQGFGYDSWIGHKTESTWGTRVVSDKFLRITEENFKLDQSRIAKPSLGSVSQNRSVKSKRSVSGGFTAQVGFNGIETILKHAFGSVFTTTVEASVAFEHAFTLTNALPVGLTFHVNRDAANIGTAYEYEGCMIDKLTIKQELEDILMLSAECQGEDEATQTVIGGPTFPTFVACDWEMLTVQVAGNTVKASALELTIENSLAGDRFQLGSRLRKGLGRAGHRKITAKISTELESTTEYALFNSLTNGTANFVWQGGILGSGSSYLLEFQLGAATIHVTRNVSDAGPIKAEIELEAFSTTDAGNNEFTTARLRNNVSSAA
jgi:tail tube protein